MRHYVDILNASFELPKEAGEDFMDGVFFALDALAKIEAEPEFECIKHMGRRRMRAFCQDLLAAVENRDERLKELNEKCERLTRTRDTLQVRAATGMQNSLLLEKVAGLFRPTTDGDGVMVHGMGETLIADSVTLTQGLAEPWAFSEEQAERFIELVQEMDERNNAEWKGGDIE